jgi:hypothetical protein
MRCFDFNEWLGLVRVFRFVIISINPKLNLQKSCGASKLGEFVKKGYAPLKKRKALGELCSIENHCFYWQLLRQLPTKWNLAKRKVLGSGGG